MTAQNLSIAPGGNGGAMSTTSHYSYWRYPHWSPAVSTVWPIDACPHCSNRYSWTTHAGRCPQVEEVEYHPNGTVKRVKFREPAYNLRSPWDKRP